MINLNVNLRVASGSRMIYKKVVHSNLNLILNLHLRVSGVSMYNGLRKSLNLNVKMLNLNVNLRVSRGSRMIYKKVVHTNLNLNLRVSLCTMIYKKV